MQSDPNTVTNINTTLTSLMDGNISTNTLESDIRNHAEKTKVPLQFMPKKRSKPKFVFIYTLIISKPEPTVIIID